MPQMSPMSWLNLFLFFSFVFIIINIINYYILTPTPPSSQKSQYHSKTLNWKW